MQTAKRTIAVVMQRRARLGTVVVDAELHDVAERRAQFGDDLIGRMARRSDRMGKRRSANIENSQQRENSEGARQESPHDLCSPFASLGPATAQLTPLPALARQIDKPSPSTPRYKI